MIKKNNLERYFKFQFPWQFIMSFIFFVSGMSSDELPDVTFYFWDKFLHFIAFGILGIFTYRGFIHAEWRFIRINAALLSILLTIIYGATDEIHQSFVPGRYPSFTDWYADAAGAIFFILLYSWIRRRWKMN